MAGLKFDITGDNSNMLDALQGTQNGVKQTAKIVEQSGQSIEQTFERIKNAAGLAFTTFTAKEFIQSVMQVRGEFQQLEVAMNTMLGSKEKADQMMTEMTTLAATTPFDLKSVAGGAKQLLAYGFEAEKVSDTLRRLGDIAAGLSINLGDLTYLYGTTMAQGRLYTQDLNQFTNRGIPMIQELAKQFGVADSEVKKLVEEGKVGFPEVQKVIESLTDKGGKFGGLMEAQSHTIVGQWSNIQDSIDMALNEIGKSSEGIINAALSGTSFLVEHWEEVGTAILAAASTLGIYKASLMGMTAMNTAAKNIGYDAEIAQLQALIPVKEQEAKTDLEIAAANGTLTTEKAALIASLREEAAAHLEVLEAEAAAAQANFNLATSEAAEAVLDLDAAKEKVSVMEELYDAALATGNAEKIEAAETALNTAMSEKNSAAKALNTAQSKAHAAVTEMTATRKAADTAATQLNTAENVANTTSTSLLTMAKMQLKVAIDAVNASFLASPLFWIAAVIVGVTYAAYRLATAESTHEQAIRESNEALDEQNKKLEDRKNKISSLIKTIQDENATEYDKIAAYTELKDLAPELTKAYTQQQLATMEAAESQKLLNENMNEAQYKEAQKAVEELTEKQNQLQAAIQAALSNGGGLGVMGMYNKLALVNEKLDIAATKLANMNIIRQQVADEARPIEIRVEEAKSNYNTKKAILDFYSEAITLTEDWQRGNEIINYATGETRLEKFIRKAKADIEDLRHKVEDNPMDVNLRMQYEQKQKILNEVLNMKINMANSGVTTIPLFFKVNFNQLKQQVNQAQKRFNYLTGQWENGGSGDNQNINDAIKKARKEKREADKAVKKAKTVGERKAALEKRDNADKSLKDLGEDPNAEQKAAKAAAKEKERKAKEAKRKAEQAENERIQLAKDQQRYNELVDKQALERKRKEEDLVLETEKAKTEALKEGYEKTRRTLEDTFEREKLDIERWYEDLKQKKIDSARQLFEADPKNKKSKAIFDPNSVDILYTKEETDDYNAKIDAALVKYNKGIADIDKKQEDEILKQKVALTTYLKEYGTFEEKKLAITKEYEEKTQKAKTIGEKASLEMQRNKDIEKLSNDEVYNTIDWDGVFSDLQGHTKEYLQGIRNQLQELLNTGNLPIDQMQVVSEKIQTIDSELGKQQGIWDFIGERTREHNRLVQEAADAQERLNVAKSKEVGANFKLNTIKSEVQNALSKAGLNLNLEDINTSSLNEKIDLTDEKFKSMSDVLQRLAVAEGKLIEARKKVTEATNKAKQSEDKSKRTSAQSFADWFSDAQEFIAKKGIDQIPDLLDSIGLGNSGAANFAKHGLDAFNSASGAAADFASGNYIGAVVKGVSAVKSFISAFSGGSNHEEKVAIQKEISKRIETLNTSINKLTDKIEKSYGIDALTVGQEALKLQTKNTQSAWNGLFAAGEDNYGKGHSDFYHWNKNTRYIAKSIAQDYSIGFVNSWQDLFSKLQHLQGNKGAEIMNDIRTNHADWWSIMQTQGYNDGAIGKWLDQIADSFDKVSNIVKKTKAQITGTTEDNVFSSFMDNLYSLADETEDVFDNISKNWQKMINKMVINNVLGGKYRKAIADWYEEWYSAYNNNNNIDATEISNLKEKYNEIVKNASNEINLLKEQGLLRDDSSYKQTASANSATSITYDQANVLTGLITAGNIDRVQMKDAVVNAIANITAIMSFSSLTSTTIVEIRNLMISNNSYLEDILKYTKQIFNGFTAQINDVNKNLKELK